MYIYFAIFQIVTINDLIKYYIQCQEDINLLFIQTNYHGIVDLSSKISAQILAWEIGSPSSDKQDPARLFLDGSKTISERHSSFRRGAQG